MSDQDVESKVAVLEQTVAALARDVRESSGRADSMQGRSFLQGLVRTRHLADGGPAGDLALFKGVFLRAYYIVDDSLVPGNVVYDSNTMVLRPTWDYPRLHAS